MIWKSIMLDILRQMGINGRTKIDFAVAGYLDLLSYKIDQMEDVFSVQLYSEILI